MQYQWYDRELEMFEVHLFVLISLRFWFSARCVKLMIFTRRGVSLSSVGRWSGVSFRERWVSEVGVSDRPRA